MTEWGVTIPLQAGEVADDDELFHFYFEDARPWRIVQRSYSCGSPLSTLKTRGSE